MKPKVWGPHGWIFLHSITLNYPENPSSQDKKEMKNFFEALRYALPCDKCAKNLRKHMRDIPLTDDILNSRDKFINWLIDIHNEVNKENGKRVLSHRDARQRIEKSYY
jgi:hypothetical protein